MRSFRCRPNEQAAIFSISRHFKFREWCQFVPFARSFIGLVDEIGFIDSHFSYFLSSCPRVVARDDGSMAKPKRKGDKENFWIFELRIDNKKEKFRLKYIYFPFCSIQRFSLIDIRSYYMGKAFSDREEKRKIAKNKKCANNFPSVDTFVAFNIPRSHLVR